MGTGNKTHFLLLSIWVLASCSAPPPGSTLEIPRLQDERWWAGVITDSYRMPFETGTYEFDFHGDTAGNQGQPLLISNLGRYVWSDEPFRFRVGDGKIVVDRTAGKAEFGQEGQTLREVYRHISNRYFPPSGKIPDPVLFTRPQFNTWIEFTYNQNQEGILDYARQLVATGFDPGVLMIDEGWFSSYGNWEFDRGRFRDPQGMMDELHALGFRVMLWVCPYITPDGAFFKELWLEHQSGKQTVWMVNANRPDLPAIMEWWDGFSAVVDLTNPQGDAWFRSQLDHLMETYGVDGFKFDGGDAVHYSSSRMLSPALSFQPETTPNQHSEAFARLGLDYPLNEYRAAWKMGGQPIAMRLRDKEHNWEDLRKLIPGILAQGIMGYPFSCPDLIGGGEYLSFVNLEEVDQELIVRSAQCHALMPMMQFSVAPWRVLSPANLQICVSMGRLHTEMGETILNLARESAQTGEPIVRSLEYQYPGQGYVDIGDQFLLGEDILVAPVLQKGARTRTVVFPPGLWLGEDGTSVEGPSSLEVEAPLERLPWYRKEG